MFIKLRMALLMLQAILAVVVLPWLIRNASASTKPNIVVILADDLGFSDIGCYGGEIDTPHLDRLAREGLRFTQFYNNGKCTTTRASLLSGIYPRSKGNSIPLDRPTIGEALQEAGYQTALVGKWHLGSRKPQRPYDRGFDEFYGLMDGCCNFFNPAQPDPAFKGGRVRTFGHNDRLIREFPPDFYATDAFTDHSLATIRRFAAKGKPFFLHLAYTSPHFPLHAPSEWIEKYRGKYRTGWDELRRKRFQKQLQLGILDSQWKLSSTDPDAYSWESSNHEWEDLRMATYAAMVDRMDQNIGKLLNLLQELRIEESTLVLFLSDNGGCAEEPGGRDETQTPGIGSTYTAVGPSWGWAQNTPFRRFKATVYEGGISTPMIARWKGQIRPGGTTSVVSHVNDVMPTCLEIAGLEKDECEGRSLLTAFDGYVDSSEREICWEWGGNRAIRIGDWKLVWDPHSASPTWQLYDVRNDRTEQSDRAMTQIDRVESMRNAFEKWWEKTDRVSISE